MIGALIFANPGKPVASRRRRSRSRTARTTGKEIRMARTRTRRRAGRRMARNAKGHFVKRRRATRRHRNPSGFIKVGRRKWRKITKYATRRRRGSRRGQIRGFHFPKRYRRSRRRRVHSNPVVVANPRRHRRARRNPSRRSYRHVRRNPSASYRLSSDPVSAIKNALMSAFSMDTVETVLQMGVGFGGSLTMTKLGIQQFWPTGVPVPSYAPPMITILSTALLTGASSLLKNPKLSARILTGGLFAALWQGFSAAVQGTPVQMYVPTLSGSPETDAFRKAIEAEVLKELKGGGVHGYLPAAGAEGFSTYLQPAGISYLRPAGSEAYLTSFNTKQANAGMGAYLTQVNTEKANAGMGHDGGEDEFSRRGMPEKF
jgi:hypothetical protein